MLARLDRRRDDGPMRMVLRAFLSIAVFSLLVVLALVSRAGPEQFDFVPTWVWWILPAACVAFLGWALFNPKSRRKWREGREEARERHRKLTNFDLD
jgi:hypothetical protein